MFTPPPLDEDDLNSLVAEYFGLGVRFDPPDQFQQEILHFFLLLQSVCYLKYAKNAFVTGGAHKSHNPQSLQCYERETPSTHLTPPHVYRHLD